MKPSLLQRQLDLQRRRVPYAVCTVADAKGSVPGKVGFSMIVTAESAWGTVGGGGLEERAKSMAREALRTGGSGLVRLDLAAWKPGGLDSVCGGTVDIAIQVVRAGPRLLLVGGGHVAKALADVAAGLEWPVAVLDDRPDYATRERWPRADEVLCGEFGPTLAKLDLDAFSHVYLLGYSHHKDVDALVAILRSGFAGVVGVVGSTAKLTSMRDRALAAGVAEASLARVRSPIGVDVGAETPEEIAVAVAAEIIRDTKQADAR
ncbi:MAG TPA: XdhC/CoxI family protein [Candidatus Thermoplasmatota archaeon]|nr:XdhC/CoxI family protein [Candidatus Thermoplasmatota archaeon]